MKKIFTLLFSCFIVLGFSQDKKLFTNYDKMLAAIRPNVSSWLIIKNNKKIISVGSITDFTPQEEGFKLDPTDTTFYTIAYKKNGRTNYVHTLRDLERFIGRINNSEEAALKLLAHGYFIDLEFKNIAASYRKLGTTYELEIGKITSVACPFQKTSYTIVLDELSGAIITEKLNEVYTEVYRKDCDNNPHRYIPPKQENKEEVISIYR